MLIIYQRMTIGGGSERKEQTAYGALKVNVRSNRSLEKAGKF